MARPKKTFTQKVQEEMPDFVKAVDGLAVEDLNGRLAVLAKASQENDQNQEEDEDLENAKAEVSELSSTYKEPRKTLKMQTRYVVQLIKEKGGA